MGLRLKAEKSRIHIIHLYILLLYLRLVSFRRVRDVSPHFDPSAATAAVKQISFRVCDYFKPLLARVRGIGRYRSDIIHIFLFHSERVFHY